MSALVAISTYLHIYSPRLSARHNPVTGADTPRTVATRTSTRADLRAAASLCALGILTSVLLRESETMCVQCILQ